MYLGLVTSGSLTDEPHHPLKSLIPQHKFKAASSRGLARQQEGIQSYREKGRREEAER